MVGTGDLEGLSIMNELFCSEQVKAPHIHIGRFVKPAGIDLSSLVGILLILHLTLVILGMEVLHINRVELVFLEHDLVTIFSERMALRAGGVFVNQLFYLSHDCIVDIKRLMP